MINYATAQKLKDAGWPQGIGQEVCFNLDEIKGCLAYPTLSELIEACGDRFRWLGKRTITVKRKDKEPETRTEWEAQAKGIKSKVDDKWQSTKDIKIFKCSTPEEAVANLYLALNKHD